MNLFVAIFPDPETADTIDAAVESARPSFPESQYRFVRSDKRHCTYLYIGDHENAVIDSVVGAFAKWAATVNLGNAGALEFDTVGTFPPNRRGRVVALTRSGQTTPGLRASRARLVDLVAFAKPDVRAFSPHVTIAYRRGRGVAQVRNISIPTIRMSVTSMYLVVAVPGERGTSYRRIAEVS